MKRIYLITCFLISLSGLAQEFGRTIANGQIIVESNDLSGITVFNKTSNSGTITNDKGEFSILVALNDFIEVSAVQYKNIGFNVNEDILKSKSIKIFLIEEIKKLDEIVIYSKGLTGNLGADLKDRKPYKPKLDVFYFGIKHKEEFEFESDNTTKIKTSAAMEVQRLPNMVNGLNIVNIVDQLLLPLFRAEVKDKEKVGVPDVPIQSIKYYFGSEFLVDNFDIPVHRVEEFIRYVESNNFDFNLLNYGREMEFLQVLSQKSKAFLNNK
ncbi:MAG: carboxypeptidase-like regulatory domain-containing protein [Algibacter sp.]